MGGYAAIAFCDELCADRVIAIAPQYSIDPDFDTRWSKEARAIKEWHWTIKQGSCQGRKVTVIYDELMNADLRQITHLKKTVQPDAWHEIHVPFGGHTPAKLLAETGQISVVTSALLEDADDVVLGYRWSKLRTSSTYLFNLGAYAARHQRYKLAALALNRMLAQKNHNTPIAHNLLSTVMIELNQPHLAIAHIAILTHLRPNNTALRNKLSRLIEKTVH